MEATTTADVARALERWREVTAPLSHARNDRDAQLMLAASAPSTRRLTDPKPETATRTVNAWSHSDFVARVASFGVATWFAKPLCISPLACARFGWVNSACDLLTCAHCARVLCFKIDDKLSDKGAEAVAAQFARQLESAHDDSCPWSHNASPESFTMLPLLGPSQVAQAVWERTDAMITKASGCVDMKRALLEMQVSDATRTKLLDAAGGVDEKALKMTLAKRLTAAEPVDERVLFHAALLAACGWVMQDKRNEVNKHEAPALVVSCEFCNRHVPVSVTPASAAVDKEETKGEDDEVPLPPAKRQRVATDDNAAPTSSPTTKPIDLITEHRWFCPWVVPQRRRTETTLMTNATTTTTNSSSGGQQEESLADFVALPGWRQCARGLRHLDTLPGSATTSKASTSVHVSALDALAAVQSVLTLPDSY